MYLTQNLSFQQLYKGGDVISSSAEMNSCMLNESPISLEQNTNQVSSILSHLLKHVFTKLPTLVSQKKIIYICTYNLCFHFA
jgi:hypothetical protein